MAEPDQSEIDEVLNQAHAQVDEGGSRFSGQSYEDGLIAMHDWMTGATDEHPYPDE